MLLTKLRIAMVVVVVSMIAFGASLLTCRTLAGEKESPAKQSDKEKLQGTWIVASAKADGKPAPDFVKSLKLIFAGEKVTFHFEEEGNALVKEGTYKLNATKKPMELDFTSNDRTQEAIYTFEKDQLKLALAEHGQARPTEFTSPAGSRQLLVVFKREKSAPKDTKPKNKEE